MGRIKKKIAFIFLPLIAVALVMPASCARTQNKIGVIYAVHGGMDTHQRQYMWDAVIHQFSYDHNHPVYRFVTWNSKNRSKILDTKTTDYAVRFLKKYNFEYKRIGGKDPFHSITDKQVAGLKAELKRSRNKLTFEVDWVNWMGGQHIDHYPYPRFFLNPPGKKGDRVRYCGENEADGPWPECDPDRYDVDGPAERLLKKGVSRIIMVDLTVGGARFSKTFEVVQMTRKVLDQWNAEHGSSIPLIWINDYTNLMERSYPIKPEGWTRSLGLPKEDRLAPLKGSPNPVAEDPQIAELHVAGIETRLSDAVSDADTGVVLFNHALFDNDEVFDPKINDTITINSNIKSLLLKRHPDMDSGNIVGAFAGNKVINPANGLLERTRAMRGQTLGNAWVYQSAKKLPGAEWGYRYWEALEYLKNRGVKHIVICFPQIITDSVLNLVEIYCQIGKEIGTKTWLRSKEGDYTTYPGVGHPFPDYWGNWVHTDCGGEKCCFKMGGCDDGRPYPPPRQTPLDKPRESLDPSLVFDMSEYGHLGYDPALGSPDPNRPVQNQYTGTWDLWIPPNDDPRIGKLLAGHVINAALNRLE